MTYFDSAGLLQVTNTDGTGLLFCKNPFLLTSPFQSGFFPTLTPTPDKVARSLNQAVFRQRLGCSIPRPELERAYVPTSTPTNEV
jgi:hypothetical protein